jgi:hypothetical protein
MPATSGRSLRTIMSVVHIVLICLAASSVRASHDECNACGSMGVLPANGMDRHAACKMAWSLPVSGVDMAH